VTRTPDAHQGEGLRVTEDEGRDEGQDEGRDEGRDETGVDRPGEESSSGDPAWLDESPEEVEARRARRRERREAHNRKVHRRHQRRRIAIVAGVTLATLLVLGVLWFWWTFSGLARMPDSAGQTGAHAPGTTILLIGSDPGKAPAGQSRPGWRNDLVRSDLVMLLHMSANQKALYAISIPRSSILDVPGVGPGTISDAAVAGGAPLVARTVEETTGVRLDRLAVIDLNAFREIVDILDGVVVDVPRETCGLPVGSRKFDGQAALDYIALQPCMERKDLDRVQRQQSLVRALMRGALDGGIVTHPLAVNRMLRATVSHLALEKDFSYPSMFATLWSMRHLRSTNTIFFTVPVAKRPLASQDGTDYVILDKQADDELWAALRADHVGDYLALHSDAEVLR
jgi:LCP family protein required for cell wall assembly